MKKQDTMTKEHAQLKNQIEINNRKKVENLQYLM